jgi:predicted SnoaL-like aldol condensation-catalyzing enzyme
LSNGIAVSASAKDKLAEFFSHIFVEKASKRTIQIVNNYQLNDVCQIAMCSSWVTDCTSNLNFDQFRQALPAVKTTV